MLALNIHFTHADGAFQPHERRARRRGHAVLAGPCFGDDAFFAHAFGQQALAQGVVDLVRAQVVQILTLEPYLCPAQHAAEIGAMEHRAWTPRVVLKKIFQLALERIVIQGRVESVGQFVQAGLDRLRYILAAIRAEKASAVGFAAQGIVLAHAVLLLCNLPFLRRGCQERECDETFAFSMIF